MSITNIILSKTNLLTVQPEITTGDHGFSMFNDAGTEVEVSEFIYSLVRVLKPTVVLETGTHKGVSSTYIACALEENNKGKILTFEIIPEHFNNAHILWKQVGIDHRVNAYLVDAQKIDLKGTMIDFLFLDSEPQLRFDEFIKFWPNVKPGGFIMIHDLHPSMGHHGQIYHNVYDWPYGDFREKLGPYLKNRKVQTIHFPTPRGLTLFQKVDPAFEIDKYLRGE